MRTQPSRKVKPSKKAASWKVLARYVAPTGTDAGAWTWTATYAPTAAALTSAPTS
jgi:hypothetical protein